MKAKICFLLLVAFSNIIYSQNFQWFKIGNGVQYAYTENKKGNDILVVIGGWRAKQDWVNKWSSELYNSKLSEYGVKHILSVKGPDEVCNKNQEINIKSLAEYIRNIIYATYYIDKVIIVAHSSGSFVANELLNYLYGKSGIATDSFYVNKVYYFNLDGGIGDDECGVSLEEQTIKNIVKIYAVAAFDSSSQIYSSNYETMKTLSELYGDKSEMIVINANNTGCTDKWCLHDALIISKPHNPEMYDLEKDYTLFDDKRKVITEYFDVLKK
jgi:hypothetical protein